MEFMGIPVVADQIENDAPWSGEQWGMDKFKAMVSPILNAGITIRWDQYTPFYNDGDVCTFTLYVPEFKVPGVETGFYNDDDDGYVTIYSPAIAGGRCKRWDMNAYNPRTRSYGAWVEYGEEYPRHPMYGRMNELNDKWQKFTRLLYDTFGDHAMITMDKEKVVKETINHD